MTSLAKTASAMLCVSLLAGPSSAAFRCPARGGAAWREFRSAHFRIDTDADDAAVPPLVRELEQMHALLLQALVGEQVEIPGHLRVLAFADWTDYREMSGNDTVAGYYLRGRFGEPTIVLSLRGSREDPELVAHELAHHLSFYLFPVQPHWFSEGMAQWVQTVAKPRRDADAPTGSHIPRVATSAHASAGLVPSNLVSWFNYDQRPLPAKELLAWNGAESASSPARGHLWSWMLYHWLWNQRSKEFADYQKRLADSSDPDDSWRRAFPDLDPQSDAAMARLDEALAQHRVLGRFAFYKVEAKSDARFQTGAISSSDLHLLLNEARIWPRDERAKEQKRAQLAEAVAEDPGSPGALGAHALLEGKASTPALRAAAAARPGDWVGWLLLGQRTDAPFDEREAALRKAVKLNPENAFAQGDLAWLLVSSARPKEALPLVNRALDLAPWNARIVDVLAEVASRMGKCKEALQLERRAVAGEGSDFLKNRQAEIERRCRAPQGP